MTRTRKTHLKQKQQQSQPTVDNDQGLDHESDQPTESESQCDSDSEPDSECDLDLTAESNPVEPISEMQAGEEASAKQLEQDIKKYDQAKADLADQYKGGPPSSTTFFSQALGLDEGALAKSGRSICLHCKRAIAKGEVRFSWLWRDFRYSTTTIWCVAYCVMW